MISSAEGTEKVILARRYQVSKWLSDGLRALVERHAFFSDADEKELGWETIFKLCRLREEYRSYSNRKRPTYMWAHDIQQATKQEFRDELKAMDEHVHGDVDAVGSGILRESQTLVLLARMR
jgi:hypothetical protein